MAKAADQLTPNDERGSVDDVDRYLRLGLGFRDDDAVFEQQQQFERGRLVLHWHCTAGADIGQEGDIPSRSWHSQLRVSRDCNSNKQHGPIDFATGEITARNDGHVFVEVLAPEDQNDNKYKLTVSMRDARALSWGPQYTAPAPQPAFVAALAVRPTTPAVKSKAWLVDEHKRRQQRNDIPKDITTYAQQLHNAAIEAVRQGGLISAPGARRFETLLHELSLFPKTKRRTKNARKTRD